MFTKLLFLKPSEMIFPKRISLVMIIKDNNSQIQTSLKLIFSFGFLYFGCEVLPDLSLSLLEKGNDLTMCSNCSAKKAEKISIVFTVLLIFRIVIAIFVCILKLDPERKQPIQSL